MVPGIDDRVARTEGAGKIDPLKYWYHADHQESVIAMTSNTGSVQERIAYDEYGKSTSSPNGEPFRYTGRRFDPETGLYYYRARYYSPDLGRGNRRRRRALDEAEDC